MSNEKFKSKIGGQALIEGVMMRGLYKTAMACRLPNGKIDLEQWEIKNGSNTPWYRKVPFLRGIFNFVITLVEGFKCMSKSADKAMDFDEEDFPYGFASYDQDKIENDEQTNYKIKYSGEVWGELEKFPENTQDILDDHQTNIYFELWREQPSKFDLWLEKHLSDKILPIIMAFSSIFGIVVALAMFMYLPALCVKGLTHILPFELNMFVKNIIEGVVKIAIFVGYLYLTSLMKDMKRTYMYHGAEHKTIACYEAELPLTVENVRKQVRFHPRCGTSFMFLVLFISIFVNSLFQLPWDSALQRMLCHLLVLPVVVGISYEFIKLAGKYDNLFTKIISAPGLWIQRITTKEPKDDMIECAILAMKTVIPENTEEDKW